MNVKKIAKILLETGETVHAAKNIELQNWTNSLSDGQINFMWAYAKGVGLHTFRENDARFIRKADLEKLAKKRK